MRIPVLALALSMGAGLQAQESVGFGVQGTLAKPTSDVDGGKWFRGRDAKGYGLRVPIRLEGSHVLVPRVDVLDLRPGQVNVISSDKTVHLYTEQAKVQIQSAALDYFYYLNDHADQGAYFGGGVGYSRARFTQSVMVPGGLGDPLPAGTWSAGQTRRAIQYDLLMGWKFIPYLGLEFRFTQGNYKSIGINNTLVKAPVFGLSLTLEF